MRTPRPSEAPHSLEAENAVLASIMLQDSCMSLAVDLLRPEHFHSPRNRDLWKTMLSLWQQGDPLDLLTIQAELSRKGSLEGMGGVAYLASLELDLPDLSRFEHYADILEERRVRRSMLDAAVRMIQAAGDGSMDSRVLLATEGSRISEIDGQLGIRGFVPLERLAPEAREHLDTPASHAVGITSGFPDIDRVTMGWEEGQLILVAGRPGMGKTILALQLALAAAKQGVTVAYSSLEMTGRELMLRALSAQTGIAHDKVRGRFIRREWREVLDDAVNTLAALPLYIDDAADVTPSQIAARAMRLQRDQGLGLLIIDHVQLMDSDERHQSAVQATTANSRALKNIAKRLGVPVIALSQLSRGVEQRVDKRPILSDLRESGSLEQDSDLVIFIYRDAYYRSESDDPTTDIIIAKHRNGPTGIVQLVFDGETMRFLSRGGER